MAKEEQRAIDLPHPALGEDHFRGAGFDNYFMLHPAHM
jgi:hypothetical protein